MASEVFEFVGDWTGQVLAASVHAGHDMRPDLAELTVLGEAARFREEDPYTDRIAAVVPDRVLTHRSRFEVDLNRPRRDAVYRTPDDCWGLKVWRDSELPDEQFEDSLSIYDSFYDALGARLDPVAERGPFVLLDVHSYNHRRDGADQPAAAKKDNPEINVGTGSVDHELFDPLVERFIGDLRSADLGCGPMDARQNVAFEGRNVAWFVHDRYPRVGCVLALEFKKTFMDEWTGELDTGALDCARAAVEAALPGLREELGRLG